MKNLLLIVIMLCMLRGGIAMACPGGEFTTQASIDNFPIANPGCTVITGLVSIGSIGVGSDITNLNGFAGITRVIGNISIFNNPLLTNLNGLAALKSVEEDPTTEEGAYFGRLYLGGNPLITNLSGLGALQRTKFLEFSFNNNLTSLAGLNSLKATLTLSITGSKLTTLAGMPLLDSCVNLSLTNNSLLTSLNGFPTGIPYLENIVLRNNPLLASVNILRGTTALGRVDIDNVPSLVDLSDFNQIQSFRALWIGIGGIRSFQGLDACTSIGILYMGGPFPGFVGLEHLERITGHFYIAGTPTNPAYRSFNGLGALKSIGRWEVVGTTVTDFSGLASLEVVKNLEFNRIGIASLNGLANLKADSITNVYIHDSFDLTQCSAKSLCTYLSEPAAVARIQNNGTGCNTRAEILNSPACMIILPVTFVSFQARKVIEGNKLSWQTASEIDNKGFEIERSADSRLFTSIGYVAGNGDTQVAKNYTFTDTKPMPNSYYRLKQWDWDGSFQYSKIVSVNADHTMAVAYPNPADDFVFIRNAPNYTPISIKSVQGFSVSESKLMPNEPIDTKSLRNGLYMISVGKETLKVWVNH